MGLSFDPTLVESYHSAPQRIRVMSEYTVAKHIPCPLCGNVLATFTNNFKGSDLFCNRCDACFQLKCFKKKIKKRIPGGEYQTTLGLFSKNTQPHLLLLSYDPMTLAVLHVYFINRRFITKDAIIPRKPLRPGARRAGWQGCYWLTSAFFEKAEVIFDASSESTFGTRKAAKK